MAKRQAAASLQKGTTAVSYTYDANGTRVTKTVNGVKYTYQYAGDNLIHETRGEKSFHYYYDANGYLTAIKYCLTPDGQEYAYYASHNWRGDVVGLYNGDGDLKVKYEYDTWGKVTGVKDANGTRISDQNHVGNLNPFRYRGYYYDTESQLYYLMTRYYDPVVHRFINADGYFQSGQEILDANMNAYCGNNPVNNSDPNGNCWVGLRWMIMGPVPGVPYYCYKCGQCDPTKYPAIAGRQHGDKPRKDPRHGAEDRQPTGDRERNIGHINGEEHGKVPKGNRTPSGNGGGRKNIEPIARVAAVGLALVAVVAMVVIVADDITGVGAADDVALVPLGATFWEAVTLAFI